MNQRILTTCVCACALALTACSTEPIPAAIAPPTIYTPTPLGAEVEKAANVRDQQLSDSPLLGSLRPDKQLPSERIPHIFSRSRLIVGVDQSQNLLSFRDPATGELRGFEIDLAKEIARDIFGTPDRIEFRYVDSTNWIQALDDGTIDIAMRTISITPERQGQVAFSTPYFTGNTRILVEKSANIHGLAELAHRTICVTDRSTGAAIARNQTENSDLLIVKSSADCLIALQQNQADAIITDDTILSGMAAQDPQTTILAESLNKELYGIAIAKSTPSRPTEGLTRQINTTLERIYRDGTWQQHYNTWLGKYLPTQQPPALNYQPEQHHDN